MRNYLLSEAFAIDCRMKNTNFIRNRLLNCRFLFLFILNLLKQSIAIELINFSQYFNSPSVTRSALSKARVKLSPSAFISLNNILTNEFYADNLIQNFNGLNIYAIDGTTLELPIDSQNIIEKYGGATNQTNSVVPMARASYLYDVINGIVFDAIIAPYKASERDLAIQHLEKLRECRSLESLQKSLVIMDRGYPSAALIIYMVMHNIPLLMRCNKKFMKEIDSIAAAGKRDKIIKFSVDREGTAKVAIQKLFPNLPRKSVITLRVIIVTLNTGEKEILITTLLDKQEYPFKIFLKLYFNRWGIEGIYKFHKVDLRVENWSGKSCIVIEQDFHALVLASNARALIALEAHFEMEKVKRPTKEISNKYICKINKNVSIATLKNELVGVLMNHNASIEDFCENVKQIMKKNLIPIRPGRTFRRIRKHPHRKYHMNLR